MNSKSILYTFACGGFGTRLNKTDTVNLPKAIFPLDHKRELTPLEYHLCLLKPIVPIALHAGKYKNCIQKYLMKNNCFGHKWSDIYWIPSYYHPPEILRKGNYRNIPDFPYGAGAWFVFENNYITQLQKKGISIILQTDGNKVGERKDILEKMIDQFQRSSADCLVAVYHDSDKDILKKPEWHLRFDILVDGKGYPKGYAPSHGKVISGWYMFKINCLHRLWNPSLQKSIVELAAKYPQKRQWQLKNKTIDLNVVEINIPILLKFFTLEVFEVSRCNADLGIGLKTRSDIRKCKEIFERRENEGFISRR